MQEILVVVAIAAAVIFIPRLMNRNSPPDGAPKSRPQSRLQSRPAYSVLKIPLTGWMRLAIVITFLWVVGSAAYLKPWEGNTFCFFLISLGPSVAFWGLVWAWFGYKKYRR